MKPFLIGCSLLISIMAFPFNVFGQRTFQNTIGWLMDDKANTVLQTVDSGYVLSGYTNSFGTTTDAFLLKTDKWGIPLWSKLYGGSGNDIAMACINTSDGGFLLGGYTNSFGAGFDDAYLIKTDVSGALEWTHSYGGNSTDKANALIQASDGGYIMAGGTYSFGGASNNVYVVKTDDLGNHIWSRAFGEAGFDEAYSVCNATDSGYMVLGTTTSFGAGGEDIYLLKVSPNGDALWSKTFGGISWDRGQSIQATSDGGYIIIALTESFDLQGKLHYDLKCYILKINSVGGFEWSQSFGVLQSENIPNKVIQTYDGGYCVIGYTGLFVGDYFTYLAKLSDQGDLLWSKTFGVGLLNGGYDIKQTSDSGFVLVAHTNGMGVGNSDIHLIKTDNSGESGCLSNYGFTFIKDTIPAIDTPTSLPTVILGFDSASATTITDTNFVVAVICDNKCPIIPLFSVSDSILCLGDTLFLANTSNGGDSVLWKLNDSVFSTDSSTLFIPDSIGSYKFTMYLYGSNCKDSLLQEISVTNSVLAGFSYSISNLTVSFLDSSNSGGTYFWDFGNGNIDSIQNPTHIYEDTGTYNVCLTLTNSCGAHTVCEVVAITCKDPIAGFTYTITGLTASFIDTSSFGESYHWIFGDGNTEDSIQNPAHTYALPGEYNVCIVVINDCGPDAMCIDITIDSLADTNTIGLAYLIENQVSIFPNIINGNTKIRLSAGDRISETYRFMLFDLLGNVVYQGEVLINNKQVELDIPQLEAGIYLYLIESQNRVLGKGKIMISN